ncbi:MAG: ATP synthase F0 subunit B [Lachnospiraceae bacterium]|nr:ATP synthase F0 subunit B [Lachnospiraceae bacterium]
MPLGIDFLQIFLHLFNVVILFGGLYVLLYAPVKSFMQKREEHYKEMEEQAKSRLADADKLKEDYENKLRDAWQEIAAQKKKAAAELEETRQRRAREAKQEAQRIIEDARKDAEKMRSDIVDDARRDISGMIGEVAEKLLLEGAQGSVYDAFLDDVERSTANGGE